MTRLTPVTSRGDGSLHLSGSRGLNANLSRIVDALGDGNYVCEERDLFLAGQKLDFLVTGNAKPLNWTQIQTAIQAKFLNTEWLTQNAPWALPAFGDVLQNFEQNEKRYLTALMWLGDQLMAMKNDVRVVPKYIPNGIDGGLFYSQRFEPQKRTMSTPNLVFSTGTGGNAFDFTEMALQGAQMGYAVVVSDHPAGAFSDGYENLRGKRINAWGYSGETSYDLAMSQAVDGLINSWGIVNENSPYVIGHISSGLFETLGWLKNSENAHSQNFKGVIDLGGVWKLGNSLKFLGPIAVTAREMCYLGAIGLRGDRLPYSNLYDDRLMNLARINGTDTQTMKKLRSSVLASRLPIYRGHLQDMASWDAQIGNFADSMKGVSIDKPYTFMIAPLDDYFVDALLSIKRLSQNLAAGQVARVVILGTNDASAEEKGIRKMRLEIFKKKLAELKLSNIQIVSWEAGDVGHFYTGSKIAIQKTYEEMGNLLVR